MSANAKLAEALFFMELLDALDLRQRPLTLEGTPAAEVSYLFGAVLNALYAALEHAKPIVGVDAVKAYKKNHPLLGGDGLRNTTIHERHIAPDRAGYIPGDAAALSLPMRATPRLVQEQEAAANGPCLPLGDSHYIEFDGIPIDVCEVCLKAFADIHAFLRTHGAVA